MKLKCRINEKEYDIVAGSTFSEEYNETLDSGTIILDHVNKIEDLKPYDDVYIWDSDKNFDGFYNVGDKFYLQQKNVQLNISTSSSIENWEQKTSSINIIYDDNTKKYKLSGTIFDIWSLLIISEKGYEQYKLNDKIIFKIVFNVGNNNVNGYYELPINIDNIDINNGNIKMFKVKTYKQESYLPNWIKVSFNRTISTSFNNVGSLSLSSTFLSTSGFNFTPGNEMFFSLDFSIEKNDYDEAYKYCFYENTNLSRTGTLTIKGISKEELLSLVNADIVCSCEGKKILFNKLDIKETQDNVIKVTFGFEQNYINVSNPNITIKNYYYISFDLNKIEEKLWISSANDLNIKLRHGNLTIPTNTEYYIDFIYPESFSNAKIVISSSDKTLKLPTFFKHLLVDGYSCEMIDLDETYYKYKISLMSETKRLEKICLPNISITQPIVGEKRTIWYYLNQFVNLYSPKYKVVTKDNHWEYVNKFKIDCRKPDDINENDLLTGVPVSAIFNDNIYAPEMTLTSPSLRDVLSRLMIVKDCIPVVKNNVIYAMDISKTHGVFQNNKNVISFCSESLSSDSYSTAYRRKYENAISQKNTAHFIERMNFRNKNNALLTLDNMYLETRFPIYKINKMYMCYYVKVAVKDLLGNQREQIVLCKQDITNLILQNEVRNALPADWTQYKKYHDDMPVEEMSQYRILTLGYSIGSNQITGWGEKFSWLGDWLGWTTKEYTYLEAILNILSNVINSPFGVQGYQFLQPEEYISESEFDNLHKNFKWKDAIISMNNKNSGILKNLSFIFKTSIFFEMDYIGMYSGTVIYSKEKLLDDNIETFDNCSSSLSILEEEGNYEKEKINRLSNPTITFISRYNSVEEMNETYNHNLGSLYKDNVVIYHREYQIYDDFVLANFIGSYDYVLKNYFTTVFAKYRTYSYASYSESVIRSENEKYNVLIGKNYLVYENEQENNQSLDLFSIFSSFFPSEINNDFSIEHYKQVNGGYFSFFDSSKEEYVKYYSDVIQFVSGLSLCFNIKMFDTITSGNYISNPGYSYSENDVEVVGSIQNWYKLPIRENDAFLEKIGCYFGCFTNSDNISIETKTSEVQERLQNNLLLPLVLNEPSFYFGKEYSFCKDDKEIIDYTLQYELFNKDNNIYISDWVLRLTEFNNYIKFFKKQLIFKQSNSPSIVYLYGGTELNNITENKYQQLLIMFKKDDLNEIINNKILSIFMYSYDSALTYFSGNENSSIGEIEGISKSFRINFILKEIHDINKDYIYLKSQIKLYVLSSVSKDSYIFSSSIEKDIKLEYFSNFVLNDDNNACYYFKGQIFDFDNDFSLTEKDKNAIKNQSYNDITLRPGLETIDTLNSKGKIMFGISTEKIIYEPTMYIFVSTEELKDSIKYEQYKLDTMPSNYVKIDLEEKDFGNIFSIKKDEHNRPYIYFKSPISDIQYKSVQYWYLDKNGDNYLHFVFGINIADQNVEEKYYLSIIKNKNPRVYNHLNRVIGLVSNCALEESADEYGQQTYKEDKK